MANCSSLLCKILDDVGFSESGIKQTHVIWSKCEEICNLNLFKDETVRTYISGSWMEGFGPLSVGCKMKTDIDIMFIIENWIASRENRYFKIVKNDIFPAFVKLELIKRPLDSINDTLPKRQGKTFLSSLALKEYFVKFGDDLNSRLNKTDDYAGSLLKEFFHNKLELDEKATKHVGPAYVFKLKRPLPLFEGCLIDKIDFVVALRDTDWHSSADEWINRSRHHNWPSKSLIEECVRSGCILVPKGRKQSPDEGFEWRISFNLAITKLLWSLKPIQYKCLAVLKCIYYTNIKPQFEETISSFIMKNAIFWHLEEVGDNWNNSELIHHVSLCLLMICEWVKEGYCPDYFIPECNLFEGKQLDDQKSKFDDLLTSLRKEINGTILQIPLVKSRIFAEETKSISYCGIKGDLALRHDFIIPVYTMFLMQEIIIFKMMSHINEINTLKYAIEKIRDYFEDHANGANNDQNAALRYLQSKLISFEVMEKKNNETDAHCQLDELFGMIQDLKDSSSLNVEAAPLSLLANIHFYTCHTKEALDILNGLIPNYKNSDYRKFLGFITNMETESLDVDFKSKLEAAYAVQGFDVGAKILFVLNHHFSTAEIPILPKALQLEISCSVKSKPDSCNVGDVILGPILKYLEGHNTPVSVDPLVFASLLQFLCYCRLNDNDGQLKAIENLRWFCYHKNTQHKNTAFNILGHCYVLRKENHKAFKAFSISLNHRRNSKSTIWHVAQLLNRIYMQDQ